jgi:Tfp pilus assembly protein PilN
MIRINLLPKEERIAAPKITMPKFGSMVPLAVVGVVLLLVGATAVLERARLSALKRDVTELREEVRAIQPQVDRVRRLTAQREDLERRLDIIRTLDQGRFLSVRVMDHVSRNVPRYLWLTDLEQTGGSTVTVSGITFSNLIVADLMMRLERSELFANVDLTQTNKGEIDEREVMEFAITATLTPDEVPGDFKAEAFLDDLVEEGN